MYNKATTSTVVRDLSRPLLLAAILAALPVLSGLRAQSAGTALPAADPAVYRWQEQRTGLHQFYHYVFSDLSGKKPRDLYLYVSGPEEVQILQNSFQHDTGASMDLITHTLDRRALYPLRTEYLNLLPQVDKSYRNYTMLWDYSLGKKLITGVQIEKGQDKPVNADQDFRHQAYLANDLGMLFATFFRHIREDVQPFTLVYGDALGRFYDMDCFYEKDEVVNGQICHKYAIAGRGMLARLGNVNGAVWMSRDAADTVMVKHTMNMRVDWTYASTMVVLKERRAMSPEAWLNFQRVLADRQRGGI